MARKTRDPDKIVRDWKGRFSRTAGHKQSANTKALRKGITERRATVAEAAAESRRPAPNTKHASYIRVPSPDARASVEDYGMRYKPSNAKVVEQARAMDKSLWEKLPVKKLPARTPLEANEETIKLRHVAKVVNGEEDFREGYVTQLWRADDGKLHIVDGHTRTAMYYALNKPMPVQILDAKTLAEFTSGVQDVKKESLIPDNVHTSPKMQSKLRTREWKLDKMGFVNDVAGFSTPSQIAGEDNPAIDAPKRAEVLEVAEEAFVKAVDAAPEIRASMRRVVAAMGGDMQREYDVEHDGIPTASKQLHSIYRKLQKEMLEQGKDDPKDIELKDTVRFSATFDESNYVDAVNEMRKVLVEAGNKQIKPAPILNDGAGGWELGGYRGINFAFESSNGVQFEVQIHTKKSLECAEINHRYYDLSRKSEAEVQEAMDSGKAEKATGVPPSKFPTAAQYIGELNRIMNANAEQVPLPSGVAVIDKDGKRKFVLRKTSGKEYTSASTGQAIKKPSKLW